MTIQNGSLFRAAGTTGLLFVSLLLSSCHQCQWTFRVGFPDDDGCGKEAKVCAEPTVRALAQDIDELERHIERFGSVVAKQPDVWGQARMTKHREEFEKQLVTRVGTFIPTLQGSLSRTDQAYFANAFALSAAISGSPATLQPPTAVGTQSVTSVAKADGQKKLTGGSTDGSQSGNQATDTTPTAPQTISVPAATPPATSDFDKVIHRTDVFMPTPLTFAAAQTGIALEPTLQTDQEARFLNHLQHIRRINEGDDTADSPGYSLNLVRIPVSLLPGKRTDTGYGAEISITATPYLSDELLPTTFRNLVINDLVDQLGLPLTEVLNDKELVKLLDDQKVEDLVDQECDFPKCPPHQPLVKAGQPTPTMGKLTRVERRRKQADPTTRLSMAMRSRITIPTIPATKSRRARLPFPPSQLFEVYGIEPLYHLAQDAHDAFVVDPANRPFVHYPDVQSFLQEELAAAYKFLANPNNLDLWQFCNQQLATAVHAQQDPLLERMRCEFLHSIDVHSDPEQNYKTSCFHPQSTRHSATAALAWAIIVEAALLNDQLIQDMKETAAAKACSSHSEIWQAYYDPSPSAEARQGFNEYVRCRWPIHVFALDPMTEDQNIADAFSLRREMQLAMSLAFVSGQISASNMTKFARRIEQDYETIALNRTIVGFSHGEDTFGWRFYPRFQTPDIEGNITVFFRDLLIGGPNRNVALRQRKLEPGPRDCAAIIIMPSFVPYVTFESSANWFKLTNPKRKELNAAQAMRLSRSVRSIQQCGPQVADADCYRGGDLALLLRKAEQLSQRLPFQSQLVQVPYENTLGGFAMFNTGVTDLAPQLNGWYGSEGIDINNGNTVFLVGDHFSVLSTRVLVGGKEIDAMKGQELLSRQVVKVNVPPGAQVLHDKSGDFVEVNIATPYGVTHHLLIPVVPPAAVPKPETTEGYSITPTKITAAYYLVKNGDNTFDLIGNGVAPDDQQIQLNWADKSGSVPQNVNVLFAFDRKGVPIRVPAHGLTLANGDGGSFAINSAGLTAMVNELILIVNNGGPYKLEDNPLQTNWATTKILISPIAANAHAVQPVESDNQLEIEFKGKFKLK
jgi:hypothetical protein